MRQFGQIENAKRAVSRACAAILNGLIDYRVPRSGIDQIVRTRRLAYRQVIRVDADRVYVQQSRIATIVSDDHAGRGSLLLIEDFVVNATRPVPIPNVEVSKIGVVPHEV